jgi:hypothetical protein
VARLFDRLATPPPLTPTRARLAYATAIGTDILQFALGPLGWLGAVEALDVATAVVMWRLLGFHPLLLPTFMIELLPIIDVLPTWTGCAALVIASRRGRQEEPPAPPAPPTSGQIIDV